MILVENCWNESCIDICGVRTIHSLKNHILPKPLFHCTTRLHVAGTEVLPSFQKLGLPPSSVRTLAIL